MNTRLLLPLLAALALPLGRASAQRPRPIATLPAFRSDQELRDWFRRWLDERNRRREAAANCKGAVRVSGGPAAAPSAAPRPAVIRGRVSDVFGNAVPAASLHIADLSVGVRGGADGRYRVSLPANRLAPPRRLTIVARTIGYAAGQHTMTLSPGDSVELDFTLCEARYQLEQAVVEAPGVAGAARADISITNTQTAGVDEGGIVKLHGDHLVILRRGRLFTVAIGQGDLRPIAAVDAFGPGIDPRGTWYDELLLAGDKVVVVGYSYARGGTELGVFRIDGAGGLQHLGTYQLRSNDYYSSRNYASRLIGTKLVFYAPLYLWANPDDLLAGLPAMRRWVRGESGGGRFQRIAAAQRVYRAAPMGLSDDVTLHTVTACDLATAELTCEATVVIGPSGRVFYVSADAVYVWMSEWRHPPRGGPTRAILCRMPLDGSSPSAVGVAGSPVDQFSFLESDDGYLNVLVRADARGDAMWVPEWTQGQAALLRVPLDSLGDGSGKAPAWWYRALPTPEGDTFHNRFVGDYLLYGVGSGWGRPRDDSTSLYVAAWREGGGSGVMLVQLGHGTDRIEVMGSDAVVMGARGADLCFSGIRLGRRAEVVQRFTMKDAAQGELRSHGFFYRPDGADAGVLGLPVRGGGRPGYEHLFEGSAGILFLRNDDRRFDDLGVLRSGRDDANDGCRASCIDWYGNARPLFIGHRVLALLGYELVEGGIRAGRIEELRRVSFSPVAKTVSR